MSRLGSHVDPILALFALPWLVWPSPVMLLVLAVGDRRHRRVARLPAGRALHARPTRRRAPRRRLPAVPGARVPRAQRVPPSGARDPAACCGRSSTSRRTAGCGRRRSWCSPPPAKRPCRWCIALHGHVLRPAQALVAAADRHGARPRLLRRGGVGDHPALQRRPERLHRPLRQLWRRRRRGRQEGGAPPRADDPRTPAAVQRPTTGCSCCGRSASPRCSAR